MHVVFAFCMDQDERDTPDEHNGLGRGRDDVSLPPDETSGDGSVGSTCTPRRSDGGPYRDARDVLLAKRRRVLESLEHAEHAAEQAALLRRELDQVSSSLRTSATPMLARVRITTPCRERWEDMVGDEVVRHCARCDKDVYDLASMTTSEAEALLTRDGVRDGSAPCVRLRRRRDGRVVTADCPPPSWTERASVRVTSATAGAVALAAGAFAAVSLPMSPSTEPPPCDLPSRPASGSLDAIAEYFAHAPATTMGVPALPPAYEVSEATVAIAWPGTTRLSPARAADGTRGVQVFGVHETSALVHMGLQEGDLLLEVSGRRTQTPAEAIDAVAELRTRGSLSIAFERDGQAHEHWVSLFRGEGVPRRGWQ